ncbi:MAG: nucleotide exchange factor GrpE [Dehalococcoidia bacterium]|nr:nucleotide exchange factor GrpE [Dehalococcoidia bacterium]
MLETDPQEPDNRPQEERAAGNRPSEAAPLEALRAELEEADRERGQFKALAQRSQADLANFRKRMEEEREEIHRSTAARLITKLLPILDDMQRALGGAPATTQEAAWLDGIRIIERSLRSMLESEGATLIEAEGKPFDPWEHEALYAVEDAEKQEGMVVTIIRSGYKLHGKVLRTAQVAVAQGAKPKEQGPADIGPGLSPKIKEE